MTPQKIGKFTPRDLQIRLWEAQARIDNGESIASVLPAVRELHEDLLEETSRDSRSHRNVRQQAEERRTSARRSFDEKSVSLRKDHRERYGILEFLVPDFELRHAKVALDAALRRADELVAPYAQEEVLDRGLLWQTASLKDDLEKALVTAEA